MHMDLLGPSYLVYLVYRIYIVAFQSTFVSLENRYGLQGSRSQWSAKNQMREKLQCRNSFQEIFRSNSAHDYTSTNFSDMSTMITTGIILEY